MSKKPKLPGVDALFGDVKKNKEETQTKGEGSNSKKSSRKKEKKKLVKYSLYMEPETIEKLESAWFRLRRRRSRSGQNVKITRWKIAVS